ncbi:hypothetical protein AVEN_271243-1 [Araneus ventricosus]|uniref:Uncharacterized protein n=1 Tax=Araneus ventricosus TaxID=182803 RepID=A0A4Y2G0M1_ARAVE|nr:hypothetical protein AVEN_271243-1 [Araneus ventricosus]
MRAKIGPLDTMFTARVLPLWFHILLEVKRIIICLFIHVSFICAEQRNLQSRGRTSWLLARNVRVHFHRHHGEVFPEGRQMEDEIQKEEEEDSTDF